MQAVASDASLLHQCREELRPGFGVTGSGLYIDSIQDLQLFLQVAPTRIAMLLGAGISGIPVALIWALPILRPVLATLGGVLIVGGIVFGLSMRIKKSGSLGQKIRWFVDGALISLIPLSATFAMDCLLLGANLGLSACISLCITQTIAKKTPTLFSSSVGNRVVGGWLYGVHVFLAPLLFLGSGIGFAILGEQTRSIAKNADIEGPQQHVVVVAAPDFDTAMYVPVIRQQYGEIVPKSFHVLSQAWKDYKLLRTGRDTFELQVLNGTMV